MRGARGRGEPRMAGRIPPVPAAGAEGAAGTGRLGTFMPRAGASRMASSSAGDGAEVDAPEPARRVQSGVVPASQEGTGLAPEMEDVRSLEALPARRAGNCGSSQRRRQILQAGASPASPFPRAWACPRQTGRDFSERKPRTGSIFPHGRRRGCCPWIGFRSVSHVRGPDACRWGRTGMPCTCSRLRA